MKGLLGRKLGMTQVFTEDGVLIPVTVVEVTQNAQLKQTSDTVKKQIQVQSVSLRKCATVTWT